MGGRSARSRTLKLTHWAMASSAARRRTRLTVNSESNSNYSMASSGAGEAQWEGVARACGVVNLLSVHPSVVRHLLGGDAFLSQL
jgi:hypothetical protein